jgi:NAD-dependent SIR2 family protein deacetylase
MSMEHLDGNAAAGLLAEVFTMEATTAIVTCAGCGGSGPLGAAVAFVSEMGTVIRCANCDEPLIRAAEIRDRVVFDMRGAASIGLTIPG